NPEVLKSAELEWFRVGDGIGQVAERYYDIDHGIDRDRGGADFQRAAGLEYRLAASFLFWVGFDRIGSGDDGAEFGNWWYRLNHLLRVWAADQPPNRQAYKMMPLFPAFILPALIFSP